MYDRYAPTVRRVLARILGSQHDFTDAVHDVFVEALRDIRKLRDPDRLEHWLVGIAVYSARARIRRTTRGRWLTFRAPEDLPEVVTPEHDAAAAEALRAAYAILDGMDADLRIVFALRFIDGMKLEDVADACGVSLATAKRRIREAERRFRSEAREHEALAARLDPEGAPT